MTAVAGLDDVEEMKAAGVWRERRSEVAGFAAVPLLVLVASALWKRWAYSAGPMLLWIGW